MLSWAHLVAFLAILICANVIDGYKVSVVEYMYQYDKNHNPETNLLKNLKAHTNIIKFLKGKSELVVFPDGSLSPSSGSNAVYLELPPPSYSRENFKHKVISELSDAAKYSNLYVVLSLPETVGQHLYSSYLVFRRNGTVAARYRKNDISAGVFKTDSVYFDTDMGLRFGLISSLDVLFPSPALDLVRQGVRYFVYPSAWSSRLPYFTATQMQQSWSWSQDVTLLAAGLNNVHWGQTGSGIYTGRRGHMTKSPLRYLMATSPTTQVITASLDPTHTMSDDDFGNFYSRPQLLKSRMPTTVFDRSYPPDTEELRFASSPLSLGKTSLNSFTTKLLVPERNCFQQFIDETESYRCQIQETLCHGDLCCQFDVAIDYMICNNPCNVEETIRQVVTEDSFYFFRYRLAVLDGIESPWKTADSLGVQICSVVSCLDKDIGSCGLKPEPSKYTVPVFTINGRTMKSWAQSVSVVTITGNFTNNSSTLLMPNLLLGDTSAYKEPNRFGILSNRFVFESILNNETRLLLPDERRNLGTVAVINRIFSRDGPPIGSSNILSPLYFINALLIYLVYYIC